MLALVRTLVVLLCVPISAFTCQSLGALTVDRSSLINSKPDDLTVVAAIDAWASRHALKKIEGGSYSTSFEVCGLVSCHNRNLHMSVLVHDDSIRVSFDEGFAFPRSSRSRELESDLRATLSKAFGANAIR